MRDINIYALDNQLNYEEFKDMILKFSAAGIQEIRFTGGEPLVRKNIESLIYKLKCINGIEEIYITTNGVLLHTKIEDLKKKQSMLEKEGKFQETIQIAIELTKLTKSLKRGE